MEAMREVLSFWFPDGAGESLEIHKDYWTWRMGGGADDDIITRFSALTARAAEGALAHWAQSPRGRLALIIVLDQFPRSVWRGTPEAFALDPVALAVCEEGLDNGDFDALDTPWEKAFFQMPLGHCEGPRHLERLDRAIAIGDRLVEESPEHLRPLYLWSARQPRLVREVIERFGRHPHRNAVLGRESTPEEAIYISTGEFPHNRAQREGL
jgi:uncharacterized protein (DUF924 family)